ncbi:MAG: TlpA family protein disulfide reductase [Draconibacterium sp.]
MKKLKLLPPFSLLLFCLFVAQLNSASGQTKEFAVINGTWNRGNANKVSLFKIVEGRPVEVATCQLQEDRSFALALPVSKETFYSFGTGTDRQNFNKYVCYLKPGDVVNVAVNDTSYTLVGENTQENKSIEKWHNFIYPMEEKALYSIERRLMSTYVDFFPLMKQKEMERHSLEFENSNNPVFDKAFEIYRENDFLCSAVSYNFMPRTAHPEGEDMVGFYDFIDLNKITATTNLLQYPFGTRLTGHLVNIVKKAQRKGDEENFFTLLKNDTLIGEQCIEQLPRVKSYAAFLVYEKKVEKYIITDDQKLRWNEKKVELAQNTTEGQPAIDFSYPNMNGDTISLSDLKGKVVVIDVWATWCGPCKQQIPFLKKMEEEYRGKDVEFLSVSIDVEKDHQKWADFVKKEELKGIQLFASGWDSDIVKFYNIKGIPRFILVDKQGNLVSANAPRPSQKELKTLIDTELSK